MPYFEVFVSLPKVSIPRTWWHRDTRAIYTITFSATGTKRVQPLSSGKLYCSTTKRLLNNLPRIVTWQWATAEVISLTSSVSPTGEPLRVVSITTRKYSATQCNVLHRTAIPPARHRHLRTCNSARCGGGPRARSEGQAKKVSISSWDFAWNWHSS